MLVLRGVPGGEAWRDPEVASRYDARKPGERWEAKQETAGAAGAVAVLAAEGDDFANDVATRPRPTSFFLPLDAADDAPPVVRVSPAVTRALLATAKGLPGADEFLAKVDPRAFTDPGLPLDAAHVEEALRWAGPAAGMTLYLDRTDGTHGGSDLRRDRHTAQSGSRYFGYQRSIRPAAAGVSASSAGGAR